MLKELAASFKRARRTQSQVQGLLAELEQVEFVGLSNDGSVQVSVSGTQHPLKTAIPSEVLAKSADEVAGLVLEAMQDAFQKASDSRAEAAKAILTRNGLGMMFQDQPFEDFDA